MQFYSFKSRFAVSIHSISKAVLMYAVRLGGELSETLQILKSRSNQKSCIETLKELILDQA